MSGTKLLMDYNIDLDLVGAFLLAFIYTVMKVRYSETSENQKYRRFIVCSFLTAVFDMLNALCISNASTFPIIVCKINYFIYYMCQIMMAYYICSYIASLIDLRTGNHDYKSKMIPSKILVFVAGITMSFNLFYGFFNDFDHQNGYTHGPFFFIMFAMPVCMTLYSLVLVALGNLVLSILEIHIMVFFYSFVIGGVALRSFILVNYMLDELFVAFGALGVLFLLETPDYRKLMETMNSLDKARRDAENEKNISNRYRIEAEKQRDIAQSATKAKDNFIISMSHEIRTPINAVLGMNEIIYRNEKDPELKSCAESAIMSGNTLLSLINDILDLSRIESGNMELIEEKYDVASLIQDSCNIIRDRAEKKNLKFYLECNENVPGSLIGDMVRIRQVIVNMLTNAVKYTDEGSVIMKVACYNEDSRANLIVRVIDTGIGIKKEDINKVFEKFGRAEMTRNAKVEGTGLGMPLSRDICKAMGGDIEVESTYGSGSVFTAFFPQKIADSRPIGKLSVDNRGKASIRERYHLFEAPDARLLVVDDTKVNLKLFKKLIEPSRIQVDTAQSGDEALQLIRRFEYDIIFMDHLMPVKDGVETFKEMQDLTDSLNKDTPVIMLTANAMTGMREEYLEIGFKDYLPKPVKGEKLELMIMQYLPKDKVTVIQEADAKT
ncbi:ATP-binding protein [Butyrivibrio fibrisolvens]|uniref:ATP-binding protein n=1 Tax=Butyrivibrio fibrisolvens TaxID=831 RepID=UPI00041CC954|nr:ATP-binding protein [Butyrivibrio fibrisolvens]